MAQQLRALPWVADGVDESEKAAAELLIEFALWHRNVFDALLENPWVEDGIRDMESQFLVTLENLNTDNKNIAAQVIAMPWAQDDITGTEARFLDSLENLEDYGKRAAAAVIAMPWVVDGVTTTESDASEYLFRIAYHDSEAAAAIIAMPFLQTLEEDDVLAIRGIHRLARKPDDGLLPALLQHPALRNGITDDQTTLVAAAGTLWDIDEIRRMLNPGYAGVEVLSEGTELTPNLKVSIVSPGFEPGERSGEVVWSAVTSAERAMGIPLPLNHVIVVLSGKTVNESFRSSYNLGYAITILPEFAQDRNPFDIYMLGSHTAHEAGHFYWIGNEGWLNEGGAKIIQRMYGIENGASPGILGRISRNWGCYSVHDLAALSSSDFDDFASAQACKHYLGYQLFDELFDTLGAQGLLERLRDLYGRTLKARNAGETPGIAEVRQTFHDQADIVEKHWSGQLNAPENRPFDEGVYRKNHGLVQWDQYPTYDGKYVELSGTLLGDAVLSRENLDEAKRSSGSQNFDLYPAGGGGFEGRIFPPGRNWTYKLAGDNTAVEYRLEGNTFSVKFPFPKDLGSPSDYGVHVWGFRDGSRTTEIYRSMDRLGYARIRAD